LDFEARGAAGNLIDRLLAGKVTDFISVGVFPVFNIADSSISIGVVVLLLGVWLKERSDKKKAAEQAKLDNEQPSNNDKAMVNSE
jgi:signal peptidase II